MPAAAVIPAPVAYIKVAAVKKLVVEFLLVRVEFVKDEISSSICLQTYVRSSLIDYVSKRFTLRKLECSRQASAGIH